MSRRRWARVVCALGPSCIAFVSVAALSASPALGSIGFAGAQGTLATRMFAGAPAIDHTPVQGARPFLALLCEFADGTGEPKPRSYFENLLGSDFPGIDNYWREASYGRMSLEGSKVGGWVRQGFCVLATAHGVPREPLPHYP